MQHCHFTSTCSAFANENSFFHITLAHSHTHSQIDYSLTVSNSLALCPNQRSHYLCPLCLFSALLQKQCLHFLFFLLGTCCDLSSGRKPPWLFKLEKNISPSTVIKQVHAQTQTPPTPKKPHPGVQKTDEEVHSAETLNPQRDNLFSKASLMLAVQCLCLVQTNSYYSLFKRPWHN